MSKKRRITKIFAFGIFLCFIFSSVFTVSIGSNVHNQENYNDVEEETYWQYANDWNVHCKDSNNNEQSISVFKNKEENKQVIVEPIIDSKQGTMNSSWPMVLHDVHHTGQSFLSTTNNRGAELWRIHGNSAGAVESSAVIDRNGTIYFGTKGSDGSLYAMYPDGTLKWRYATSGASLIWSTPAIAEDGTIYVPTWGGYPPYLYALHPNGSLKWTFGLYTTSSPAIGIDGTIYIGDDNQYFYAINPDGTEQWRYTTGDFIQSSPAIADDGTIYVGSADTYLYAFYPNGTLRWRFQTGGWIKSDPSIGADGTIYVPSFDGNLYAINPDGTLKWSADAGNQVIPRAAAIATDGTLYVGTEQLRAFYPNNGTVKWTCDIGGQLYGTSPAISADGTIYVSAGGSLVAVNPDGSERWRKQLTIAQIHSSPIVGPDDRVYVGSENYGLSPYGYLHAFGIGPLRAEAYGPYTGAMTQPLQFNGEAFGGTPPYITYHWDFGDGANSNEQNPIHTYAHRGNYTATLTIIDTAGNHSSDTTLVTIGYPLPQISLLKPTNAVYLFNIKILPWPYPLVIGKIMFEVEATQVEIGIDHVEFYYDGQLLQTDDTAPYQYLYTGHWPPLHQTFMFRAYDTRGNSNTITETINKWF